MEAVLKDLRDRMEKAIDSLKKDMSKIRTGRANPAILDDIRVDAYGQSMELRQLASITVPEARQLMISPWDKGTIDAICKSLNKSDLNLPPNSDGNVIRLNIPELTTDRRKDLVKEIKKRGEEAKVAVRNIRRDGNEEIKKQEKAKDCSEDDAKKAVDRVQKLTDEFVDKVDAVVTHKEKDILDT